MYGQPYAQQQQPAPPLYRQNVYPPADARSGPVPGPALRTVKLVLGVLQTLAMILGVALFVAGAIAGSHDREAMNALMGSGMASFGFWYLGLIAYGILNAVWLYKIWSWVPPDQRHSALWKKYISPGQAVGFMFIPYFNVYWIFVMYFGLCDAFERLRVAYPMEGKSPKNLAIAMIVVSFVFFPAAPILHYLFDKRVEELAHEAASKMSPQMPAGYGV